jgi:hypothetical protein
MGDGMFHSGDMMWVNVVTGERRTLRTDIFRSIHEVYLDEPDEGWGDQSGIFLVSPLACSPDGEWLFFRQSTIKGRVSVKKSWPPALRALNLKTGEEHVLSPAVASAAFRLWPAPDGRRLLVAYDTFYARHYGTEVTTVERHAAPPHWEIIDLPSDNLFVGLSARPGSIVVMEPSAAAEPGSANVKMSGGPAGYDYRLGIYDLSESGQPFHPLTFPVELQRGTDEARPAKMIYLQALRQGRLVGYYYQRVNDDRDSIVLALSCGIDGQALRCREALPKDAARSFFVWARDGESFYYERRLTTKGNGFPRAEIVHHDMRTGKEDVIAGKVNSSMSLRDGLSPKGDKIFLGYMSLKVLFLQPPQ